MNVIKRCCMRSLKENRKRTMVTVTGVILATALITGVACLAESMRASLISYEKKVNGDFHYCFSGVDESKLKYFENNTNIQSFGLAREVGYADLEGSENPDKPYLYIREADEDGLKAMSLELTEGRMPESADELVISRHIHYNGMVDLKVGDTLTLQTGARRSGTKRLDQSFSYAYDEEYLEPAGERTYTIVGVIERPSQLVEGRYAPGYSVFSCMDDERVAGNYEVYATYTARGLRDTDRVTAGLLGISEETYRQWIDPGVNGSPEEAVPDECNASYVQENWALLKWEQMRFSDSTLGMLYGMAVLAVIVIIVTSVFCIRNSFVISLTEKMKLYGRLASVGTTPGQQRKMVYYEAVFLGLAGIPIGIFSGLAASVILVKLVSGLVDGAMDIPLLFGVSVPAILLSVVLSGVTVLLSAMQSARRAARISPISAIRANDSVKIGRREMRCPGLIDRLFGVGGRIAWRNLRRARRKYRTTVISIVVSVAVFIGLTTFVQLLQLASGMYYTDIPYQIRIILYDDDDYETAERIARLEGVQAAEIFRVAYSSVAAGELPLTEDYKQTFLPDGLPEPDSSLTISICSLGEEGFARFCENVGVDVSEAQDKAIALTAYETVSYSDGKSFVYKGDVAEFQSGDIVTVRKVREEGTEEEISLEILAQASVVPMSLANIHFNTVTLIVSDQMMDDKAFRENSLGGIYDSSAVVYIQTEDAGKIEEMIRREIQPARFTVTNYASQAQAERNMYLVVAIFLYGFITVVALIGITNIFNTITTNLELRAPEFAMLRAVGMTGREFQRMIWLEGLFYGGKALMIGIPLGIALSVGFHLIFAEGIVTKYRPPFGGVLASAAAVAVLLYLIMHYSMKKINRENIIDTIRNENL